MAMTVEQIAFEALGLPATSRAALAEKLIASLDETEDANGADIDALWVKEAERRYQEIREGKVTCYSLEEFLGKAEAELKE
jgi:hypothetical protein